MALSSEGTETGQKSEVAEDQQLPDPTSPVIGHGFRSRTRWLIVGMLALVTLVGDQLTKAWALNALSIGEPRHVIGTLQFNLAFNTGMAFSRGANSGPVIGMVALLITGAMIYFARHSTSRIQLVAMGAIIGGAFGNVVDRVGRVGEIGSPVGGGFMSGSVVDFIDVQFWPIFNLADAAVVVGGIVLALSMLWVGETDDART